MAAARSAYDEEELQAANDVADAAVRVLEVLAERRNPGLAEHKLNRRRLFGSGPIQGWRTDVGVLTPDAKIATGGPMADKPLLTPVGQWAAREMRSARMSEGSYPTDEYNQTFGTATWQYSEYTVQRMTSRLRSRRDTAIATFARVLTDLRIKL
jgi:hypothetical protein